MNAVLTIRNTCFEGGPPVRIFNSVNGTRRHQVPARASSEIPFDNGIPVGTPPDSVSFDRRPIGP